MTSDLLGGVRVLDLTGLLPGPYCSLLLAELGAEVIKIESTLGDLARQVPPFVDGTSAFFASLNHSKRSLGIDLRRPEGVRVFLELVRISDVLLEGFRPGRMDRLGLGPETCQSVNPRLVYASLSGYGQTGPDRGRAGHDLCYVARAGLLALNRRPGEPPVLPPVQIADLAAGSHAAVGICAALFARERTGRAPVLDVSMWDSIVHWMGPLLAMAQAGLSLEAGNLLLGGRFPFYNVYRTADNGWVALATIEPLLWLDFCRAVERPDLAAQQFVDGEARAWLFAELEVIFAQRTVSEWAELIHERDLAAEVVIDPSQVLADRQLAARSSLWSLGGTGGKRLCAIGPAIRCLGARPEPPASVPALGEHTSAILGELLGLPAEEIQHLVAAKVVFGPEDVDPRRLLPATLG